MAEQNPVVTWLKDAYSIENTLTHILDLHAKEARHYPPIQQRLNEHLAQTRHHAELVKGCIERLGGEASKHTMQDFLGSLQSVAAGVIAKNAVVTNAISDTAAEHFEIATYTAIITAARCAGDEQTAGVCQQILRDEEEMARWLEEHLPAVVKGIAHERVTTA